MNPKKSNIPTSDDLINGGELLDLPLRTGKEVRVYVRQVTASELLSYLKAEAEGEEAVLAMTCRVAGSDEAIDLDTLTLESYEALLAADQRQNFTAARAREKREAARAARQMAVLRETDPELYRKLQRQQEQAMESLLSSLEQLPSESGAGNTSQPS